MLSAFLILTILPAFWNLLKFLHGNGRIHVREHHCGGEYMTILSMDSLFFSFGFLNEDHEAKTLTEKLELCERQMILHALHGSRNVTRAAEILNVSKQRLHYKIEKHGITWKAELMKKETAEKRRLSVLPSGNPYSLVEVLEAYEKKLILEALESSVNAKTAADQLGISKQALNYKLNKYKIKEM